MSQISVVQYNASTSQKLNVLQQNTSTNHAKAGDRHIIVLRKPPPILPQPKDYPKDEEVLITNPGRKGFKKGGKDLKTNPQPIAVARRNARERNRVKQVNNGFANLRQHIPSFIAQAFETNSGRGNKKLSKVETLRMAVEYIKSLEEILSMDGYSFPNEVGTSCPSPTSQNDSNASQSDLGYSFAMSPSDDEDDFSSVATPSPQQYIRINTSNNTYEIVPATTLYENSENMDPMTIDQQHHHMLEDHNLLDLQSQDLSYLQVNTLQTTTTTGSLSPGIYSEGSLSPHNEPKQETLPQNCFIPVFATGRLGENFNVHIKTEMNELPVISLKSEDGQQDLHDGMEVNWWEPNTGQSSGS